MADKKTASEQEPVTGVATNSPASEQEGLSLQDAGDIVALIDRLVEAGKVKGEEIMRVGVIRTKLVSLIKKVSENNTNGQ